MRLRHWLPELGIAALLVFFSVRELGTFPASWVDEGLFLIVAKMWALGHGYVLPILTIRWAYPYFLNVGPTIIYASGLSMKLFGLSTAAARLPMVAFLWASAAAFYVFVKKTFDTASARWATLLLVTFSGYINTGKPVLGEIPAFLFLILGFIALERSRTLAGRTAWSSLWFGLSVLTKITFGIVLPALLVAWLVALQKKQWKEAASLTVIGLASFAIFFAWRIVEIFHTLAGSQTEEIHNFIGGGGRSELFYVVRKTPGVLLRFPYLSFAVFVLLGGIGIWEARKRLHRTTWVTLTVSVALFLLYFLDSFGWYRLLLPAHLLLLPFVPAGLFLLVKRLRAGKELAAAVLAVIIGLQGMWQLTHQGSDRSPDGEIATRYVEERYATRDIIIQQTEVFARLPDNPHWYFLLPNISFSIPATFTTLTDGFCRMPVLRKLSPQEVEAYRDRITQVSGSYFVITPRPGECIASPPLSDT